MKKPQTKTIQWINTGIFPANILFSHGYSYDEITKHLKKVKATQWYLGISQDKKLIDGGEWFALKRIVSQKNKEGVTLFYIILKPQFQFTDYHYCILAHEVLHICQFLLPTILDRNTEIEAEAYLHTHIMEQCLKHIRGKQ